MIKKILVAFDGSKPSERAFEWALEVAKQFHSNITVLSVARPSEPATAVETQALLEAAGEHFEQEFKRLLADGKTNGIPVDTKIVVGHPAEQIVHYATEGKFDLIVMGHRGRSLFERWLLGSVSKRVLSYAPCTATVVR